MNRNSGIRQNDSCGFLCSQGIVTPSYLHVSENSVAPISGCVEKSLSGMRIAFFENIQYNIGMKQEEWSFGSIIEVLIQFPVEKER